MKKIFLLFFLFSFAVINSFFGQITANGNSSSTTTVYTNGVGNDQIYIWSANGLATNSGSLTAVPGAVGAGGPYTFTWFYHNEATFSWSLYSTSSGLTSTISSLASDGYRCQIQDNTGAVVVCYNAWVWNMNGAVSISQAVQSCVNVNLTGSVSSIGLFNYYNPPLPQSFITASTSISVSFSGTHTFVSDLAYYVKGPAECGSPIVQLAALTPGSICNVGDDINNLTFNTSSLNVFNVCNATVPLSGTYGSFVNELGANFTIDWSPLYGCNAATGDWKIQIYDCTLQDVGFLTHASISFSGLVPLCNASSSLTYDSGIIISEINDNSCTSASASVFDVPISSIFSTPINLNATTTYVWSASPAITFPSSTTASLTQNVTGLGLGTTIFTLTETVSYGSYSNTFIANSNFVVASVTALSSQSTVTQSVCTSETFSPISVTASGSGLTYQWYSNSSSSNSGGTLIVGATSSTYTPPSVSAGTKYYYCIVSGTCGNVTSAVSGAMIMYSAPTAIAGGTSTICSNGTATVSGTSSSNGTIAWTENGSGSITSGATTLTPVYSAAAGDAGTTVTLTMTVTNTVCTPDQTATATYSVIVNPLPTAIAGGSTTICSNETATVSGASSTNGTISWTENGTGSITSGGTTLTPTYTAAIGDAGNVVTLIMTVTSSIACTPAITATSIYTINVTPLPTAISGGTATVCSNEPVTVSGATSSNGTISWTENGAGSITAGSTTLTPTYTPALGDAGNVVTLTMTVTSTTCTPIQTATAIYTITVNPIPTAIAGGTATICSNSTVTVSGASSTNGTILWTENGVGSITSGATSLTPIYTAAIGDAGNTVTLTMTVTTSNCTPALTATATYTVIVNPLPTAISGGTSTICSNETITVSGATSSNGTIAWTENGAGSITAGATTLTPTYTAAIGDAGTTVILTMTVTSTIACTPAITSTAIYTVIVNPLPTAVSGGTSTICSNETVTVSGASATNGTISWTENGAGSITAGAATLTPTYTAAAGDAGTTVILTMTVNSTIACTPAITATAVYTVIVNPLPTAISGGTSTICSNGMVTVSGASSSNGTISWTENGAGTITSGATTLTPTYTAAIGDAGTTVTLTMTVTSTIACTPAITSTAMYTVIVNPLPTAVSGGTSTICSNEFITVSGASSTNGTIVWTENGAGSITSGANTLNPTYTPSVGDAGTTVTLTMTVTSTIACTPEIIATAIYTVTVNPLPTASAGGTATICSDETVTVSGATSTNGTILWTENGAGSITAGATTLTPTYSAATGDAGTTVTLTMTVTSTIACNPAIIEVATFSVIVNPLPTALAGGIATICADESATVSGASSSNGTIFWTHNGAGTIANATTLTPTYTAAAADGGNAVVLTMTVTSTISCTPNITATAIYTVNVNPIPVFFITGFNPGVCTEATGHIEVTGLAPNTNYTINYIDDAQPVGPLSLTSNGTGLITFPNLDAGSYEYFNVVISATGCSTLSLLNTSLLNPTAPVITDIPNVVMCATQYTLPIITGLALTGSEAYFTLTQAGGTMYHAGDVITSSQTLFIYDANGICTGQENFHIQLDQLPTALAGGISTICSNEILTVSGASATNGTILWTHNGAGSITAGATSLAPTYSAVISDAGNTVILTMTVTSDNTCGTVVSAIYTINVTPLPSASAGGVSTICYNESLLIGGTSATNGTILWTHDGLGTLTNSTTLTPTYTPVIGDAGTTVILTMTVTSTIACTPAIKAVANYAINVNPLPTASSGGVAGICSNSSVTVSGASATNGTILWTHDGDGSLINETTLTPTYTPSVLDAGNIITLTMTVTSTTPCVIVISASALFVVTVNPIPTAFAGGNTTICSNETATVSGASSTDGTILWTENGVGSITSGATTLTPTYTAAIGDAGNTVTLTMTVTSTIACTPAIEAVATYTVNVNPLPTSVSGGTASICTYETVTVSGATSTNGTILWTHNGAGTLSNTTTLTPTYTAVLADGGNIVVLTMSVTSTNCLPAIIVTSHFDITVKALPVLASIIGDTIICKGFSSPLTNPFLNGVWSSSFLTTATVNSLSGIVQGINEGFSTINYEVTVNGCSNSTSVLLTVHGIPNAPQVIQPEIYCSNAVPPNMVVVPEVNGSVIWSSDAGFSSIIGTSNFLTPKLQVGETIYYVANIVNECQSATSEIHIIIEDCPILIPSAFTPDQDNFNDTWILTDLDFVYPKSEVSIFNRWGALLYKTGPGDYEQNSWDGTFNGEKLPVASYYYTIEYNNGKRPPSSGTVTIVYNK